MFPKRTTVALMLTLCVGVQAEPAGTVVSMREASAATFYVPARLPGLAPGELMVDTGSGFMTINETTLEQLQHGEQVEYVKKVEGVLADGSRLVVPIYRISRLDIGERCTLRDVEAAVFPGKTRQSLGLSALRKAAPFTFSIDPPQLVLANCVTDDGTDMAAPTRVAASQ